MFLSPAARGHSGLKGGLSYPADRLQQALCPSLFLDKGIRAGFLCPRPRIRVAVHGQDHHRRLGSNVAQPLDASDCIDAKHLNVHDDHVGNECLGQDQRFSTVACLTYHLEIVLQGKSHSKPTPNSISIIDQ
jgi:hypothetical protein